MTKENVKSGTFEMMSIDGQHWNYLYRVLEVFGQEFIIGCVDQLKYDDSNEFSEDDKIYMQVVNVFTHDVENFHHADDKTLALALIEEEL